MSQSIVLGLGFGDEGKGLVTDWLCSKVFKPAVIRYSGGHQVGHCVRTETDKHIFSNFGSGTLRGVPTFWNAKTVDPVGFCKEYKVLSSFDPIIQIDPLCPVTTPYEKELNQINEITNNHGSIGVGFGTTIEREEKNYHLYFQDLFYPPLLQAKLDSIKKYYRTEKNIMVYPKVITQFLNSCQEMTKLVKTDLDVSDGYNHIYESSQGLMIDMDYGIFPNVTRSKLGTQELEVNEFTDYFLVTRAYQTRHGNGYCSDRSYTPSGFTVDETNFQNKYQGEFKTRILDLDLLKYVMTIDKGIRESNRKNLVITCLDHMKTYEFMYKGKIVVFENEYYFIQAIGNILPKVNYIYLSHGPTAEDIDLFIS